MAGVRRELLSGNRDDEKGASDATYASDIAFTPAVKAIQSEKGSRAAYSRMEGVAGWETAVTPELE